ncbi:MAG: DUF2806 domain-containing protein [Flavobacteriales bacterium]
MEKNESLENNNEDSEATLSIEDVISQFDGIPLPPAIKKNLWKSCARLITSAVDIPVAFLEAKADQIRKVSNAKGLIISEAAKAAAKEFASDAKLIERSVDYFGARLVREQKNRESIMNKTVFDLETNSNSSSHSAMETSEIDDDWLEAFSRIAETKSNDDIQTFLAKILAGEIRKPGTFNPQTIQTLSVLDQATAKSFKCFCDISFELPNVEDYFTCVITQFTGNPNLNSLKEFGLSYAVLTNLQDVGLIKHDLVSYNEFPYQVFIAPHFVGDQKFSFQLQNDSKTEKVKIQIIRLTNAGLELRRVIPRSFNATFNEKYTEWVKKMFHIS